MPAAEPAPGPIPASSPVEPPEPSVESQIEQAVAGWSRAWSEQRVADYLSFYAPDFQPDPSTGHQRWRRERERRIAEKRVISVRIEDLEVTPTGNGDMRAEFVQTYLSDTYCDRVEKTLVFRRLTDGWKIVASRAEMLERDICP